jgi:hypothetical protein
MTKFGPLDVLGTIGTGHGYDELLKHAVELEISDFRFCVLDLKTLIKIKKETISEKDKAIIPVLQRTLEEKMRD